MLHPRTGRDREHGQMIVLFALVLVIILAFAAIVVDLGVLRNNRQILVNTMDAAALAGGTKMPVDGSIAGSAAAANALITQTIQANYPGLSPSDYTIAYKCLISVNPSTNQAYVSRDVPIACDPSHSLGRPAAVGDFTGAGPTRVSSCDPFAGDLCNTVVVSGSATTQYSLGPVVGVPSGSTGTVASAACAGLCGASPAIPVDIVLIMDRTGSMSDASIKAIQDGASSVLSVLDPALQRVALATIGPSTPGLSACPNNSHQTSPLKNLTPPANQVYAVGMSPNSNIDFFGPYPTDLPKWVPVGFTGTDGEYGLTFNEPYSVNKVTNTNSNIWKAISCLYSYTNGTNLDTPIDMAQHYLNQYGRPGVKKGIILETDGTPQVGDGSVHYTCYGANQTATTAKSAGIEIFTIGFGMDGTKKCPTHGQNANETSAWYSGGPGGGAQLGSYLLSQMATPDKPGEQHFFNAPDSATLINAFTQAAVSLATGKSKLVQLYPTPIVTSVPPLVSHLGGLIAIGGKYFTGATEVRCGGVAVAFTVASDTSITATIPPGGVVGQTVDVIVTTPGGTSPITSSDRYTYN